MIKWLGLVFQLARLYSTTSTNLTLPGQLDFSDAVMDESLNRMCIIRENEEETVERQPRVVCNVRSQRQCHTSHVTKFKPHHEDVCSESYVKTCFIEMQPQVVNETVRECSRPMIKHCGDNVTREETLCRTVYTTHCHTNKDHGTTECERVPKKLCGQGCHYVEENEICHDKVVARVTQTPHEQCQLSPMKQCQRMTKLLPVLEPMVTCSIYPGHHCYTQWTQVLVSRPVTTKWCVDNDDHIHDLVTTTENVNPLLDARLLFEEKL